jgi:hypothetical protein
MTAAVTGARVLVFELPLPDDVANTYQHYMAKHRKRSAYFALLDTKVMVRWLPKAPREPFAKAHAQVEVRTFRIMDRDNAVARLKNACDWLKTRRYIVDDAPAYLMLDVTPMAAPRSNCGVTITLTEVLS